jgi:hypothetical protein
MLIEVHAGDDSSPWRAQRVRLSTAIEGVQVESLLLPMYRGGTTISLLPSPLSAADIEIQVVPLEARVRALLRTMHAGTPDEAVAVRNDVLAQGDLRPLLSSERSDPWAAVLGGLLHVRFPDVFGALDAAWCQALAEQAGWVADVHVIHAQQILSSARPDLKSLQLAAARAIDQLGRAQATGWPYFAYTSQLFSEMLESLRTFENLDGANREQLGGILAKWRRVLPLQASTGAASSRLSVDPGKAPSANGTLSPASRSKGELHEPHGTSVFQGWVQPNQISFDSSAVPPKRQVSPEGQAVEVIPAIRPSSISRLDDPPALNRPPGPPDDPNKGRFGGQPSSKGYTLSVRFEKGRNPNWASVVLTVTADRETPLDLGDVAWFFLHPTFSPQRIKVMFTGRRATLMVQAWGGFTTGVWLPHAQVELECDLAQQKGAPDIIRYL